MLKTFILLATVLDPQTAEGYAYELDIGMSGEDCIASVLAMSETQAVELEPGLVVLTDGVIFSCELQ